MKRLFIVGCVALGLLWLFAGGMSKRGPLDFFTRLTTMKSAFAFSADEIEKRLKLAEAGVAEIAPLVTAKKYQAARDVCDTLFYALRRSLKEQGDVKLDAKRTLQGELRRVENKVAQLVRPEFERLMREVERGGLDTHTLERLVSSFPTFGDANFNQERITRGAKVDQSRKSLAAGWVRVTIECPDETLSGIVEEKLRRKYVGTRLRLAVGPPIGSAEDQATPITLRVKVTTQNESYGWAKEMKDQGAYFMNQSVGGLLSQVTVAISRPHNKATTSWDPQFEKGASTIGVAAEIPTPARFTVPRGKDVRVEFIERNREQMLQARAKLGAALDALPPLRAAGAEG